MTAHKSAGQLYYERRAATLSDADLPLWADLPEIEKMHYTEMATREWAALNKPKQENRK